MLLVIPAEELCNGHCSRCIVGEPGTEKIYHHYADCPSELTQLWRRENAKSLYITDRDGFEGRDNSANKSAILDLVKCVDIPISLLSAFPTPEECRFWLESGVYRLVIGKVARTHPEEIRALVEEWTPSRIVCGILASGGIVTHHDGLEPMTDVDFARYAATLGMNRVVYTDVRWEGNLCGPDLELLRHFAQHSGMRVTEAGGIANVEQLWALQTLVPFGVDSVVIGRALYENKFPCQKIWRLAEAELEPALAHL